LIPRQGKARLFIFIYTDSPSFSFFNFPARKKPASTPAPAGQGGGPPGTTHPSKDKQRTPPRLTLLHPLTSHLSPLFSLFFFYLEERLWEDFNIYGAQGGEAGASPETNEG